MQKWSEAYKKELFASRVKTTANLVTAMAKTQNKPKIFISTSATGIYANDKSHDESSTFFDSGFLGNLACEWEKEALKANSLRIKTAIFRLGTVLGKGGAMAKMLPVFKLGLGGVLAGGKQDFPWICINDLLRTYEFALTSNLQGVFNVVSPQPTTNENFTKALAKKLGRPVIFNVPEFVLRLKFGEGAQILLQGSKVSPANLLKHGFEFKFADLDNALSEILDQSTRPVSYSR